MISSPVGIEEAVLNPATVSNTDEDPDLLEGLRLYRQPPRYNKNAQISLTLLLLAKQSLRDGVPFTESKPDITFITELNCATVRVTNNDQKAHLVWTQPLFTPLHKGRAEWPGGCEKEHTG